MNTIEPMYINSPYIYRLIRTVRLQTYYDDLLNNLEHIE